MPNHWTMTRGKDVIAGAFRRSSDWIFKLKNREIVRMDVSGDMAYTVNSYYYTYHAADEAEKRHKTKNVHITQWNNASEDWHTPRAENDLKPGGTFNYRMEAKNGSAGFDFRGTC